jgi:hypothetical protein
MAQQQYIPILDTFEDITSISIKSKDVQNDITPKNLDGYLEVSLQNDIVTFPFIFRKELRSTQLKKIIQLKEKIRNLVILSSYIPPKVKEVLKKEKIGYLDSAGNASLVTDGHFILIEGRSYPKQESKYSDRAFSKTGLKLLFYFLNNDDLINSTYRDIRDKINVSLDTISKTLKSLKKQKYLLKVNKYDRQLTRKKDLFDRWISNYENKLKNDLLIGRFSFVNKGYFKKWKELNIKPGETFWSGQPAADLLTNNVIPDTLILYSIEKRSDLMTNYRLKPDDEGPIYVYQKFWDDINLETNEKTVPHTLVYADLVTSYDPRDLKIASQIYEEFIKEKLEGG